jgi:hypothetical protein
VLPGESKPQSQFSVEFVRQFMRIALNILSTCLIGMGIIWILQGVNILPGSFMTGQMTWAWRGAASVVVGALLLVVANRKRR